MSLSSNLLKPTIRLCFVPLACNCADLARDLPMRMSPPTNDGHEGLKPAKQDKMKTKTSDEIRDKESEDAIARQATPPLPAHSRHTSSKYDFVKVRVWLGDNADHYYVLSRFLVSRMLTVTKIPSHVAIKISLELKKLLIDNSLFDVSQSDLETNLFKLMERRGYGEEYINRYKMMTRFHHQRVPLVILVCGTACVGKSTVATQLAQRLNLPNVLQTDMVYELIRTSTDAPLPSVPIWEREFESQEELVTEFARECRILRKGLNGDLKKAMKDGKPIIIEGIHLDPSIYLLDEECSGNANQRASSAGVEAGSEALIEDSTQLTDPLTDNNEGLKAADQDSILCRSSYKSSSDKAACPVCEEQSEISAGSSITSRLKDTIHFDGCTNTGDTKVGSQSISGEEVGDPFPEKKSKRTSAKAIIVPIVLKMDEFDHKTLLEEWIACRSITGALSDEAKKEALINKLMTIQDYLCSFKSQGIIVGNVSATTFPQTLDALHSYLLQDFRLLFDVQRIEECQSREQNHAKQGKDLS